MGGSRVDGRVADHGAIDSYRTAPRTEVEGTLTFVQFDNLTFAGQQTRYLPKAELEPFDGPAPIALARKRCSLLSVGKGPRSCPSPSRTYRFGWCQKSRVHQQIIPVKDIWLYPELPIRLLRLTPPRANPAYGSTECLPRFGRSRRLAGRTSNLTRLAVRHSEVDSLSW